jgi:hypothetical protein
MVPELLWILSLRERKATRNFHFGWRLIPVSLLLRGNFMVGTTINCVATNPVRFEFYFGSKLI